ncbi:type II secretion system F family protein, partial [Candidatus Micrarchaeota archaeon]|nr:type II secretion system F family protein [Candidatus Micrarchaeota archaeon]
MTNETVFERSGRLLFTRDQIRDLENRISYAGIDMPADSFAGYIVINVLLLSFFLTLIVVLHQPINEFLSGFAKSISIPFPIIIIGIFVLSIIVVYLVLFTLLSSYLIMKTEDRRNKLEQSLPDFLTLVGSNIKAGMTLDQAMWYSAKPEFGLLSLEVKKIIKGAFSGGSLPVALDTLGSRFDSRTFKRTLSLLKQASATGGELTAILERTADDVR